MQILSVVQVHKYMQTEDIYYYKVGWDSHEGPSYFYVRFLKVTVVTKVMLTGLNTKCQILDLKNQTYKHQII